MGLPKKVLAACRVLGIHHKRVLASRVYPDCVVIIEGPVGYKRVISFEEIEEFEARKKAEAAEAKRAKREAKKRAKEGEEK